jgi:gas vesicle protein
MPDKSEVIMSQMDVTRKGLADKLEKLEEKVSGTVETVTDLVESVPETVESVKDSIAETVSSVTDTVQHTVDAVKDSVENTVDAVKGTVAGTVRSLKGFFDIPHHVDRHPWLMMGGSVLLGFLGGRLLLPRREPEALPPPSTGAPPPAAPVYTPAAPPAQTFESARAQQEPHDGESEAPRESWLGRLGEKFGDEISKVKGLALGTLLGVARDMVSQWVPETLRSDVKSVINNFTSDLGGKVFEEPILGENGQSAQADDGAPSHGQEEGHERFEQPEPQTSAMATTARKGGRGRR